MSVGRSLYLALRSILSNPFGKLAYHLGGLVPRDRNLWVLGAQKRSFYCNPKYLFLYLSEHAPSGVTSVWITRDKALRDQMRTLGLRAETLWSWRGVLCCLRAGYYFFNCDHHDISFYFSKGARTFNLWHGIPLKKIQFDNDRHEKNVMRVERQQRNSLFDRIFNPRDVKKYDYILSTSDYVTDYSFQSAFNVERSRCLPFGYPRTDIFFWTPSAVLAHVDRYEGPEVRQTVDWLRQHDKSFVYMPTWRDSKEDFLQSSGIDFADLDEVLDRANSCLLLKLHPYTKINLDGFARFKRIRVLDRLVDVYAVLPFTTCLITDYSSIFFDYLLLGKDMIFFCPDYDRYLADCRDLYIDYAEVTPGGAVKTYPELVARMMADQPPAGYHAHCAALREKFWGNYSGQASRNITEFVTGLAAR